MCIFRVDESSTTIFELLHSTSLSQDEKIQKLTGFCTSYVSLTDQVQLSMIRKQFLLQLVTSQPGNMLFLHLTHLKTDHEIDAMLYIKDASVTVVHLVSCDFTSDVREGINEEAANAVEGSMENIFKGRSLPTRHFFVNFQKKISDQDQASSLINFWVYFHQIEVHNSASLTEEWKIEKSFFDPKPFLPPSCSLPTTDEMMQHSSEVLIGKNFHGVSARELFETFDDVCTFYQKIFSKFV